MLDLPHFFEPPHSILNMEKAPRVLVALSGGSDSSLLLHLLCQSQGADSVIAAHVNHGIRDEKYNCEADRDEKFCREICDKLGVELTVLTASVPLLAKESGNSLETEARNLRYSFFADIMRKRNIRVLATAHNADDNLETQIFNLSRGCGIEGIAGIPRVRPFDSVDGAIVVRPLLCATKTEILDYCHAHSVPYVTDSTNLIDDCTRNRIRHNIIPELSSIFASVQRSSMRLSAAAREDADFIRTEAEKFVSSHPVISVSELSLLHIALKKRVLLIAFAQYSQKSLESVHIDALIGLIDANRDGYSVSLPDKKRARVDKDRLVIEDDVRISHTDASDYSLPLVFGLNHIENNCFSIFVTKSSALPESVIGEDGKTRDLYSSARLDNVAESQLIARNRRAGDTVVDNGMTKKLKKLMNEREIPLCEREIIPIICTDTVIYVPKCAVADKFKSRGGKFELCIGIYK